MNITAMELAKRSGTSYHQIDHWTRGGVIPTHNDLMRCGTGQIRYYDEAIVEKVALLQKFSVAFNKIIALDVMRDIFDAYEDGYLILEGGITLRWGAGA